MTVDDEPTDHDKALDELEQIEKKTKTTFYTSRTLLPVHVMIQSNFTFENIPDSSSSEI